MKRSLAASLVLLGLFGCRQHATSETRPTAEGAPNAAHPMMPATPTPPTQNGVVSPQMSPCGQYQACCAALATMPNTSAMAASCANVSALTQLGASNESACAMALNGIRQATAAMPGGPPPVCTGSAIAAAPMVGTGSPSLVDVAVPPGATAPGVVGTITVGATVQGILQQGDTVIADDQGRLADEYRITLTANAPITILTRGGPSARNAGEMLDVVTALICNGEQVSRDDDSAGSLNSRIVYTPTASGLCTIRVMGFAGDSGAYTLQTYAGALETQT